jgi:hypothetical protein
MKKYIKGCYALPCQKKITPEIWDNELSVKINRDLESFDEGRVQIGASDDGRLLCEFLVVRPTITESRIVKNRIVGKLKSIYGNGVELLYESEGSRR